LFTARELVIMKALDQGLMKVLGATRYIFASSILFGSAPSYFLFWAVWRGISLLLPKWMYQTGDDFFYSMYQRMVVFFFEHCTGQKVFFSGDAKEIFSKKEKVLYLGNHQSTVDWAVCNMVAIRQGSIGHLRYVMKDTLQMVPLYGLYFYEHGCIYVKRGDFKQKKMESSLEYLQDPKIKSWTVIFPEGTCFGPTEFHLIKKSLKAANDSGLKPLVHHLTPRYKGTFLALEKLRCNLDAVYDVTVVYSGAINEKRERNAAPQIVDFLLGKSPELYINVKRIPIEDVPRDETDFKQWMHQLFVDKDEIVTRFYREGRFEKEMKPDCCGELDRLSYLDTVPSFLFFALSFVPLFWYPTIRTIYLQSLVLGSILGYSWLAFKSVC